MGFECDAATRERLEWPRLAECLAARAHTQLARERCLGELFESTRAGALDRIAETAEVRALLDREESPPLEGSADLRPLLDDLRRAAALAPQALAALLETLRAADRVRRFFARRRETAPQLADVAGTLPELSALALRIERLVTPEGEIREDASPELQRARRAARDCQARIEQRMAAHLRSPALRPHLTDSYASAREGRPVLPVRADARRRVPGIVHDVSQSGTTLFVEPQDVVELGNRMRIAEREVQHEVERLLRELADALAQHTVELEALHETLAHIDLARARGRLAQRLGATRPELANAEQPLDLRGLRHPLLLLDGSLGPDEVIANDVALPRGGRALVISGPNAGGKTVAAKAVGLAALSLRAGLHVPCEEGSALALFDAVHADIGDDQDLRAGLSTFSARMAHLAQLIRGAGARALVILDEIGEGTEPAEGAALAQAALEALVERGATVLATTHFGRLKELATRDARFANASAQFDPRTLRPTYRLDLGVPGASGAAHVARRMGLPEAVVERAQSLLDARERDLEALTLELSELRSELEQERVQTAWARGELTAARERYEAQLETLRRERERALAQMRGDLERAYDEAREQVAAAMRELQRGAGAPAAAGRAAAALASSRETLAERERELLPHPTPTEPLDWKRIQPGERLEIEGLSQPAVLVEGPDSRGRIAVRIGSSRTQLPCARVRRVLRDRAKPAPPQAFVDVERRAPEPGSLECDLRGLRVDEALDRADAHLHQLLGSGAPYAAFIHGHGSGALKRAIRSWLGGIAQVTGVEAAARSAGGDGVTIARL